MSELKIKINDSELIIPQGQDVKIKRDDLVLEFNDQGDFSLTIDDKMIASSHPGQPADQMAGNIMPDGSICGGISPDTGKPFFTTARDAPSAMDHWDAVAYAEALDVHGHRDWALASASELNVLYRNRHIGALNGTFNETAWYPDGWYWSSSKTNNDTAKVQCFSGNTQHYSDRGYTFAVRCVRR